jgi:hypothetical protein
MEKTSTGTKRRTVRNVDWKKHRLELNVESKKHQLEKTSNIKNAEWDKTSTEKLQLEKKSTGKNVPVCVHGHRHGQGHGRGMDMGRFLYFNIRRFIIVSNSLYYISKNFN